MCWWTGLSKCQYARNSVDLRVLADIVKNHMGDVLDRTIYPERPINGSVRAPYTMDNDLRPEIVAILTCMLESEDVGAGCLYPRAEALAKKICERKVATTRAGVMDHAKFMAQSIELNLLGWHRQIKVDAAKTSDTHASSDYVRPRPARRIVLPARVCHMVLMFAETIVRAVQIYDETLVRNRTLWDDSEGIPLEVNEFNWSFDMCYIEIAAADLGEVATLSVLE